MISNSAGCIRTLTLPCSIRYPPRMAPMTMTMPMIANIKVSQTAGAGTHSRRRADASPQCIHRPKIEILHRGAGRGCVVPKLGDWRGFQAVEGFSTLVPFSISRYPTNFVGEQFWGRAARASRTRKSRDARFIFPLVFHSYPAPVNSLAVNESKK